MGFIGGKYIQVILSKISNQKDAVQNSYVGFDCDQFQSQNKFTHNLQKRKFMETEVLQQYLYQHGLEFLRNRITKFTVSTGVRGVFTKDLLLKTASMRTCFVHV